MKSRALAVLVIFFIGALAGNLLITMEGPISAFRTACNTSPIAEKMAAEPAAMESPLVQACRENAAGAPIVKALQDHVGSVGIPWSMWILFAIALLSVALPGHFRPALACALIGMAGVAASWYPPFHVAQEIARLQLS